MYHADRIRQMEVDMRLTPSVHGLLDYMAATVLIVAPFAFGFMRTNLLALYISVVLGIGLLAYSLFTDYTYSLFGKISFKIHLVFDTLAGLGAIAVPFIFGFTEAAKIYYIAVGVGVLVVVVVTSPEAQDEPVATASVWPEGIGARILTPGIHGLLDYLAVIVLIVAPFALDFAHTNILALYISVVLGIGLLGYSLLTDYTYSLFGAISFKIHLIFDALAGISAIAVPFIFGFDGAIKVYYIAMGIGVLSIVALTGPKVADDQFEVKSAF
jgi:uncharacterized membrane protein